jgi:hypothetical protein
MQPVPNGASSFFHSLVATHRKWSWLLLLTGFVVILLVIMLPSTLNPGISVVKLIQSAVALCSLIGLVAGYRRYQAAVSSFRHLPVDNDLRSIAYRKAVNEWWAMNAMPGLLSFIGFLLTAQYAIFLLGLFHTGIHFTSMPRRQVIQLILQIPESEREAWGL